MEVGCAINSVLEKGPETKYSNPGPTLEALDAFRFTS